MLKGTRLLVGNDAVAYTDTLETFRSMATNLGFTEVVLPLLYEQAPFIEKGGTEIVNRLYAFKDKGNRDICLIPEGTALIQEYWRENNKAMPTTWKCFYITRCYRYDNPQSGRYREFTQFGVEILSRKYKEADRDELYSFIDDILDKYKLKEVTTITTDVKRGLGYYVEDGFEVECDLLGAQKQLIGGGRYLEGIGFAVGIERLLIAENLAGAVGGVYAK